MATHGPLSYSTIRTRTSPSVKSGAADAAQVSMDLAVLLATEAESIKLSLIERLAEFLNRAKTDKKLRFNP